MVNLRASVSCTRCSASTEIVARGEPSTDCISCEPSTRQQVKQPCLSRPLRRRSGCRSIPLPKDLYSAKRPTMNFGDKRFENKLPSAKLCELPTREFGDITGQDRAPLWKRHLWHWARTQAPEEGSGRHERDFDRLSERVLCSRSWSTAFQLVSGSSCSCGWGLTSKYIAEQVRMGISIKSILRILCCSWTSRLGTFQEEMFRPGLYSQFFDGTG